MKIRSPFKKRVHGTFGCIFYSFTQQQLVVNCSLGIHTAIVFYVVGSKIRGESLKFFSTMVRVVRGLMPWRGSRATAFLIWLGFSAKKHTIN